MVDQVDFKNVSTIGLESSPNAVALAGLRANEARYFWNKYKLPFVTEPAADRADLVAYVEKILAERELHFAAKPLEVSQLEVQGVRWTHVFYEDGLEINVLYTLAASGKRAVGIKLSDGMAVPAELEGKFKFARQKSKLAGTIRGSFFVIKGEY
ncbi:phage tail protein [Lacticaseibacillus sp. GG6-2]